MRHSLVRRTSRSRITAALIVLAATLALLAAGPSASAATVKVIGPGANVLATLQSLKAGDTLQLQPGTYTTGYLRVTPMASGGPSNPITIMAADPSHPPLLVGGLRFYSPNYVMLRSLRIQGTAAGLAGLTMDGGTGWVVDKTEVWGAAQTGALGNVVITGTSGYPRGFTFSQNCVHDAGKGPAGDATHHNVYVTFPGSTLSSGNILRNLIFNATSGENLKIGDGGTYGALGPWNVRVANNTFAHAGRQILLHGNVRNNVIVGNLLYYATQGFVANPKTTQIYIHDVTGTGNYISHTYWDGSSMFSYDPSRRATLGTGNVHGAEPAFQSPYTCAGWQPTLAAAVPFGRWGTGSWAK